MEHQRCLIDNAQALGLAHNTLSSVLSDDGYYRFFRFSESQQERLGTHAYYKAMLKTSTDVCLRFRCLSPVELRIRRYNQSLLSREEDLPTGYDSRYLRTFDISETLDIKVEGMALEHRPLRNESILFEAQQNVEVFLPLHHQVGICLEGLFQPLPKKDKTVLLLGDSIIQGIGIHHSSQSLGQHLSRLLDAEVINQALSGSLINPKLAESLSFFSPLHAILVSLGTNDWVIRDSLAELRGDMFALLGRLRKFYRSVPIILMTPLWRSDIQENTAMGSFSELSKAIVQASRCFPNVRIADGLSLSLRSNYDDQFLHPDKKAVAFLAKGLTSYF